MPSRNKERQTRRFRREPFLKLSPGATRATRIGLFFVVPVLALVLFPLSESPEIDVPVAGQISTHEIIAPFDFPVRKDSAMLRVERQAAATAVPPVLDVDAGVAAEVERKLARLERELMRPPADRLPADEFRASLARQLGIELSPEAVAFLQGADPGAVVPVAREFLSGLMGRAVVTAEVAAALAGKDVVDLRRGGSDFYRPVAAVVTVDSARVAAESHARSTLAKGTARAVFVELVGALITPNAVYNLEETENRAEMARAEVETTTQVMRKGERILDSHERVTPEHVRIVESLQQHGRQRLLLRGHLGGTVLRNLGRSAAVCLLLLTLVTYLRSQQPEVYADMRSLAVLATLGVLAVIMAFVVVVQMGLAQILVPAASIALLAALLLNRGVALFVALIAPFLFLVLFMPDGYGVKPEFLVGASVGGIGAVLAAGRIHRRHEFYWPVAAVGLAHIAVVVALGMALRVPAGQIARDGVHGVLSAGITGAITMVLLPVFEKVFRITTNFTLLELLDRNHPLLKRMAMEAPGTFHHSTLVAELAREATAAVGGNALLAQVGATYHDIGKMEKPQYFIENQTGKNVHDKLTPTMSCLVLGSHVREGVLMGLEAGLPREVIDFIPQHHGTTLMSYFFHKARDTDENVDETDFRYPGPRPLSKETAIVMLSDSVEATARSLGDPTPGTLRSIVKRLLDARLTDGQLDTSSLTLADLARIREAFVSVLQRFFHSRIQYPAEQDTSGKRVENGRRTQTDEQAAPQGEMAPAAGDRGRQPQAELAPDGTELVPVPKTGKVDDARARGGSSGTDPGVETRSSPAGEGGVRRGEARVRRADPDAGRR